MIDPAPLIDLSGFSSPDRAVADRMCSLIDRSPSPYHAVETAAAVLIEAGGSEVTASAAWPGEAGLFFHRRGGALVAWCQPGRPASGFRIIGAHTDSPNLRIKPNADLVSAHFRQLGVEVYGGVLRNSWLDRDLGLSGRLVLDGPEGASTILFRIDDPILRLPQLAIHLDREIHTDGLQLNAQTHMAPVWDLDTSAGTETPFVDFVAEAAGVDPASVLSWDAMVHDLTPSRRTGRNGVFVSAPRLDNLCSSFMAIDALVAVAARSMQTPLPTADPIPLVVLYDHEEVGSTSSTGADGALLVGALERIASAAGAHRGEFLALVSESVCVSADMAHGTHPNYVDKHEPGHQITLNAGPVVKINANQRYASDAESAAVFLRACRQADVPVQKFVGRTDLPCGSTIGPVTAARLGIPTVDVGIAQLAMHSARELCGADDPSWYTAAMEAFLAPA